MASNVCVVFSPDPSSSTSGASDVVGREERHTAKCAHCNLAQYVPTSELCRRCRRRIFKEEVMISKTVPRNRPGIGWKMAEIIKAARKKKGLSQGQLALRMGAPRPYITKIEGGRGIPSLPILERMAKIFEVSIAALLLETETSAKPAGDEDSFMKELLPYVWDHRLDEASRTALLKEAEKLVRKRRFGFSK